MVGVVGDPWHWPGMLTLVQVCSVNTLTIPPFQRKKVRFREQETDL